MDRSKTPPPRGHYQRMKSLNSIIRNPEQWTASTRRCTDVFCIILLVVCFSTLASSYQASEHGNLKRLTHGFDYRGHLCGAGDRANASYLLWCTPTGHQRINWADPICVESCPSGANLPYVLCPLPKVTETGEDGSTWTVSQKVVQSPTTKTRRVLSYCIPEAAEQEGVNIITQLFESNIIAQAKHRVVELCERWHLILFMATLAVCFAYAYLFLLRVLARPILYASCVLVVSVSICSMGYSFYVSRPVFSSALNTLRNIGPLVWLEQTVSMPFAYARCDWAPNFFDSIVPMLQAKSDVLKDKIVTKMPFVMREFSLEALIYPLVGVYTPHFFCALGFSSAILCYALCSLLRGSRKTIKLTIGCVEEACAVLFSLEALLALPFIQCFAWAAFSGTFAVLFAQVVSAITVTPGAGASRSFHPSIPEAFYLALWVLVYFWVQEIVHVWCQFTTTYAAVRWFLAPCNGIKRVPYFVVIKGFFVCLVFHLGTVALVAFVTLLVRPISWLCFFAGYAAKRGIMSYVTHSMDCVLQACAALMHYVSPHIITETALSGSQSFCACSSNVRRIIDANTCSTSTLHRTEWVFTVVGTLSISAGTALTTASVIHYPHFLNAWLPLDGADAYLFTFVGAVIGACIGYAFMTLVNRITETLMYCYLSYKEDAERMSNTPKSLERLMTMHEL